MIGYETEEQQVQAIKQFWKDNGMAIVGGVVIGLALLLGWRWYSDYTISQKENASVAFQKSVETFVESENIDELQTFLEANGSTGYAPLAAMILAQQAVEKEDFEGAKAAMQKAIAGDPVIADIARIRLADLHLQLAEYDAALSVLAAVKADAFSDQVEELKGDALVAKGDFDGARVAYTAAIDEGASNPNVQMKLDNIAYAKTAASGLLPTESAPVVTDESAEPDAASAPATESEESE